MAEKKPKPAPKPQHRTASPYSQSQAERIGQPHHDIIVDRLVNLLAPIRTYRSQQPVSKGKKSNKRKRDSDAQGKTSTPSDAATAKQPSATQSPVPKDVLQQPASLDTTSPVNSNSPPPVFSHVLLGFNQVTRHLEGLSSFFAHHNNAPNTPQQLPVGRHVTAVFLLRPLDDLIYSHLPTLCHTASLAHPERPATRLILLEPASEKRIADAVGLPRISLLGIMEADGGGLPELAELADYVRAHMEAVDVSWLRGAREGKWMGTKIETH